MTRERTKKYASTIIWVIATVIILGYSYLEAFDFLSGPELQIDHPTDGQSFSSPAIDISGSTKKITAIFINKRQISTDQSGSFKDRLLLSNGYNIIEIEVIDRFKRERRETLNLFLSPEKTAS